jgi:hypothetical protein
MLGAMLLALLREQDHLLPLSISAYANIFL